MYGATYDLTGTTTRFAFYDESFNYLGMYTNDLTVTTTDEGINKIILPSGSVVASAAYFRFSCVGNGENLYLYTKTDNNLLVISDRTYETFSTDTANFREVTVPHELTTDKYYPAMHDGKIGKYCASKITFTPNAEVNGFTFKTSSATGYGPLFPLSITSEGKYWIKLACTGVPVVVEVVEYGSDKIYIGRTRLSGGLSGDGVEYQVNFEATDTSHFYAVYFTVGSSNINTDCVITNLNVWKA